MTVVLSLATASLVGLFALLGGCDRSERSAAATGPCPRPYSPSSPWNTPIGHNARHADGLPVPGPLTSDPTQFTYPVYEAGPNTPRGTLHVDGVYSNVTAGGRALALRQGVNVRVPIPNGADGSSGRGRQGRLFNPPNRGAGGP